MCILYESIACGESWFYRPNMASLVDEIDRNLNNRQGQRWRKCNQTYLDLEGAASLLMGMNKIEAKEGLAGSGTRGVTWKEPDGPPSGQISTLDQETSETKGDGRSRCPLSLPQDCSSQSG